MASTHDEISHEFRFFRVYKTGRIEKFHTTHKIPPSDDPIIKVRSKDVVISIDPSVSARIFLPEIHDPTHKLPILLYIHGGGFSFESAFSPHIHNYVNLLAAKAKAIAVSVEYRLAPEHPIPACYDDSWAVLQWVAFHSKRNGPESWLNDYADFDRVLIGGDSAGGNISHNLLGRVGSFGLAGVKVVGAVLVHPYFGGTDDDQMWLYMCPENGGLDDPRLKPAIEDLAKIGVEKVLVFVAEKDHLMSVGKRYVDELRKSGWGGRVEIVVNEDEEHCFHLQDLKNKKAMTLVEKFASFVNGF